MINQARKFFNAKTEQVQQIPPQFCGAGPTSPEKGEFNPRQPQKLTKEYAFLRFSTYAYLRKLQNLTRH
jgi:hypothetical protein